MKISARVRWGLLAGMPVALLLAALLLPVSPGARSYESSADEPRPNESGTDESRSSESGSSENCVILLHGLGRSPLSMVPLRIALERAGYRTVNQGYPSRSREESIETLAAVYVAEALAKCDSPPDAPVYFVAHSLGGILVRQYLQDRDVPPGSRMVMLGPPNQGSELVDQFGADAWFQVLGPAARQLGTADDGLLSRLKPVDLEIGVIAGTRAGLDAFILESGILESGGLPKPHDGRVSLTSAQLEEMRDFLEVNQSHTLMLVEHKVIRQVLAFLATGHFEPEEDASEQR